MARWVGAQGPVTLAKNALTYPNYDVIDKKCKTSHFFKSIFPKNLYRV